MPNDNPQPEAVRSVEGSWPLNCIQRAFVNGAKWWQFHRNGSTAFSSEVGEMEDEAVRRYGEPYIEKPACDCYVPAVYLAANGGMEDGCATCGQARSRHAK